MKDFFTRFIEVTSGPDPFFTHLRSDGIFIAVLTFVVARYCQGGLL